MSAQWFDALPLISSDEELTKVKNEHPRWDSCCANNGCIEKQRQFFESLWHKYEPYADRHFLKEIQLHFHQRTWEMYVANVLLEKGIEIQSNNEGPDFIISDKSKKPILYLECIAPERGVNDDKVPHLISTPYPEEPVLQAVPQDQIMLRITAAIKTKFDQYQGWKSKEWFNSKIPYAIAINTGGFRYPDYPNMPYAIRALFGVEHPYFSVDDENQGWTVRDNIKRLSGTLNSVFKL